MFFIGPAFNHPKCLLISFVLLTQGLLRLSELQFTMALLFIIYLFINLFFTAFQKGYSLEGLTHRLLPFAMHCFMHLFITISTKLYL